MSSSFLTEARQYLTFKLSEEVFGVDVAQVREILDYVKITKVPQTPDFMCGVINLRGSVVPVVDMNMKFGMVKTERTVNTCIVVVEVILNDEKTILGALVDSVQEVFEIEPENIEPAPKIGTKLKTEFIKGMGKREDKFIIILDIDKVFTNEELELVQDTGVYKPELSN
ncbi:MAG: chemotaxis protein CheW [Melioribacteraceae bacterium]